MEPRAGRDAGRGPKLIGTRAPMHFNDARIGESTGSRSPNKYPMIRKNNEKSLTASLDGEYMVCYTNG